MTYPDLAYEKKLWRKGFHLVAGVDEVGRGCFAGPVVAGCVVFKKGIKIPDGVYINDSKKLTAKRREKGEEWIKENALSFGLGEVSARVITKVGMGRATKMAFRRAVINANKKMRGGINYLLVDAFYVPYLRGFPAKNRRARKNHLNDTKARQQAIINGDEKSVSIAAASMLAKVYRDALMERLGRRRGYKRYRWWKNKGYATQEHLRAIKKYGVTRYHREAFVDSYFRNKKNRT